MAQISNDYGQNSFCSLSPDNILNLVNERLLKPTDQRRTSKLQNYFLGYREYLQQPPSPAPSDEGQLFSYSEQSSTDLEEVSPAPPTPKVLLQNPLEAKSQGSLSWKNKPKSYSLKGSQCTKGSQGTQHKQSRGVASTRTLKAGRIVKAYSQSPHQMETRSRARARRLMELEASHMVNNYDG